MLTIGVAIATMTLGNLAAITQTNIKRFFGYSTIAHVGYLLLGLVAAADGNREGLTAIVIYLLVYAFMNLGAFAVIIVMRRKDLIGDEIDDLSGLMSRAPGMAILMLIFLLSLAGIPPTAGFIGKYFIFLSLIETGHYYLAVLAVAYAVVALYYYFRIVVAMFMKKAGGGSPAGDQCGHSGGAGRDAEHDAAGWDLSPAFYCDGARGHPALLYVKPCGRPRALRRHLRLGIQSGRSRKLGPRWASTRAWVLSCRRALLGVGGWLLDQMVAYPTVLP